MSTTTMDPVSIQHLAQKVDDAMAEVQSLPPAERAKALALKAAIEEFHKEGLTRIVRALKSDARGKELLFELVDSPEVRTLLAMHGLIRADLKTRVSRAVEMVRPYMQSHGGDVELVEVTRDTAVVRLAGACNGCSMSAQTLRDSVEQAIREQVPEILHVEQAPSEPSAAFIPLEVLSGEGKGWKIGPPVTDISPGKAYRWDVDGVSILLLRTGDRIQAFRNSCAHMALPIDGGMIDTEAGTITCPWHGFRFDTITGECISAPGAQLEPFPVRVEEGIVRVRPQ